MAKKDYPHTIEYKIAGIPCLIGIENVYIQEAEGRSASNDWDCYGYVDYDSEILDRKGYPAPWLEQKVTDKIRLEMYKTIEDYLKSTY